MKPSLPQVAPARPSSRRWLFRLAAVILVPLLGLALLEGALRLVGWGRESSFFIRHPAAPAGTVVENQRFPLNFFPPTLARHPNPLVVSTRKPPGTIRLFVFGESAAEGDPAPPFGFARILEVMLRSRYPGTRFEVVNVAFTAISSHVIRPIAREGEGLEGDFWLVYMGNNEVVGPFGAGTVFGSRPLPLPLIHASLALKRTRTGQLLERLASVFRGTAEATNGWAGMTMFLNRRVPADDPRLNTVYANFAANLNDLIQAGVRGDAQVIVSTMVGNLRDCAPFASMHRADWPAAAAADWERAYAAGVAAAQAGDCAAALRHFNDAAALDDRFADLEYRRARCHLALGRAAEARQHFERARDLDTLRFRADSRINALIREVAGRDAGPRVHLLDAEQAFAGLSADGIPGNEWLHEHVHFTFAGNYQLARLFADEIARRLPPAVTGRAAGTGWLGEAECAARLAVTPAQEFQILDIMRRRLEEPVYQGQIGHAARLEAVRQRLAELKAQDKPAARKRGVQVCRQAVAAAPDDRVLREILARSLAAADEPEAAAKEWREVAQMIPHSAVPPFELGQLEEGQGHTEAALARYREALRLNPDHAPSHEALGLLLAQSGQDREAVRHLTAAVRLDPTRGRAQEALGRLAAGTH